MRDALNRFVLALVFLTSPETAFSASGHGIDGSTIGLIWMAPFAGLLLSIAVFPLLFIFLVSNIGGSLTPLGDPSLFLGFLKGVDFLWTVTAMFLPMTIVPDAADLR